MQKMLSPKGLLQKLQRLARSSEGSAIIELGFILPIVAGMIVPVVDLGMGAYNQMQLQNAVQAGAGTALTNGFNPNTITTVINANGASLAGLTIAPPTQKCGCAKTDGTIVFSTTQSPPTCNPPCPTGGVGNMGTYITVSATANYVPLLTYPVIGNSVTLSAQSVVRIQ
jgi:Flp pilus assembly protein TadG